MNSIALHIIDLVNNSIRAKATRIHIALTRDTQSGSLELRIRDNGTGMTEEVRKQALDPFFTTRKSRKLGFGLPFIKMSAEQTGGFLILDSQAGKGCNLSVHFHTGSIDMLPMGDLSAALCQLLCSHPDIEISFDWKEDSFDFHVSTSELLDIFEDLPISHVKSMNLIRTYIHDNLETHKMMEVHP